jgi:hypothetical protein
MDDVLSSVFSPSFSVCAFCELMAQVRAQIMNNQLRALLLIIQVDLPIRAKIIL